MRNVGLTSGDTCQMPLTQTVIADALGLTPIHTNRVIRALREREVMQLKSKTDDLEHQGTGKKIAGFDDNYLHKRIKVAA